MMILRLLASRYSEIWLVSACACLIILANAACVQAEEARNPFDAAMPYSSASHLYTPAGVLSNPAFADLPAAPSLHYRISGYDGQNGYNHLLVGNVAGFSFSGFWVNTLYNSLSEEPEPASTSVFGINKGFFIGNVFGFGAGYSFANGGGEAYEDYSSFSAGFLLRPTWFLSLGMLVRDLGSPEVNGTVLRREEIYSVSVRPFREILTLSFDMPRYANEGLRTDDSSFAAALLLKYGISLFARLDYHGSVSFGAALPLGFQSGRSSTLMFDYAGSANGDGERLSSLGVTATGEKFRDPIVASRAFLKIELREEVRENETERLFAEPRPSFYDMVSAVERAATDTHISGIFLEVDDAQLGFAQVQELRAALKNFKRSGKKVYAFLTASGNKEYYLATAANKVYLAPGSGFELTGLHSEAYFFKGVLDRFGVKVESVRRGNYKSFNETFTRQNMSEEYRENLTAVLKDLNEQYLSDIGAERGLDRKKIEAFFKQGFMKPEEALGAGFVDALLYPDQAQGEIIKGEDVFKHVVSLEDYRDDRRRITEWGPMPEVAVIHVDGTIIRGPSRGSGPFMPEVTGDKTFREVIEGAFSGTSTRAVVIRINSGGGSAAASDIMWHSIMEMKKKYDKPVVFSFGNMAASGGYYIACTGDTIFANGGTITGSIGVISGKLSLKRLYEMLGISKEVIKMSEFADLYSESKDLSERDRELLQRGTDFIYENFTDKVAQGRSISRERIPSVAEGRIFTGNQAKTNSLADKMGGLLAAVEYARERGGIAGTYRVRQYPARQPALVEMLGETSAESSISPRLRPLRRALRDLQTDEEPGLYLCPVEIEVK